MNEWCRCFRTAAASLGLLINLNGKRETVTVNVYWVTKVKSEKAKREIVQEKDERLKANLWSKLDQRWPIAVARQCRWRLWSERPCRLQMAATLTGLLNQMAGPHHAVVSQPPSEQQLPILYLVDVLLWFFIYIYTSRSIHRLTTTSLYLSLPL